MSFVPHSDADREEMLRRIGAPDVRSLYSRVPDTLFREDDPDLPEALSEWEAVREVRERASDVEPLTCFAGGGIYDHHVPAAVDHLIRRSEFYTAYTPYQPEVAQGTLQAIYEFQTMVAELTGMEVANASIYDGATATGEAALMAMRETRRDGVVLTGAVHPHYRDVVDTYVSGTASRVERVPPGGSGRVDVPATADALDGETACVVVQSPNFYGLVEEIDPLAEAAHDTGALLVAVVADPVGLALLRPPGEAGADIVAGEGQPFGNAMSYGGPVVGIFASREEFVRNLPGRLAGATVDEEGRRGYVLTLQTREQQIRRERATSNICTNQGLNALAATIHLATLGREGLRQVAEVSVQNAHYARRRLAGAEGVELVHPDGPAVREFAVRTDRPADEVLDRGRDRGLLAGVDLSRFPELEVEDGLLVAFTEKRSREEIDELVEVLAA
jgi:glycine dehydrogenase subunit 1